MEGIQWMLELGLAALLAATLFHAVRLERALGVLKRDRAALQEMIDGFNAGTRQAEATVARLQGSSEGAGLQLAQQAEAAGLLKDDLTFLIERGEGMADRLDGLVRAARPFAADAQRPRAEARSDARIQDSRPSPEPDRSRTRSQAERDLIKALKLVK